MIFDGFFPRAAASRPAETPTLLFLHGAACGAWVWQQGFAGTCEEAGFPGEAVQFERVVERHPAGLGDYVTQVRAAMARIGGPVVLVGHSLGALVAQRLLLEPQVKGAALLAPVPPEGLWLSSTRLALTDPSLWTESARMDAPVGQADPSLAATLFSKWRKGRGRNSPDPIFFFRVFAGVAVEGWSGLRPGQFAPEVLDLRRLTVQPARPIINIIKSLPSQS
jgi:pimeloyl-ACP methyl ester carboxylesterase